MLMRLNQYQIPHQSESFTLTLAKDRKYVGIWRKDRGMVISIFLLVWENTEVPTEEVEFTIFAPGQIVDASYINYVPVDKFLVKHDLIANVVFEKSKYLGKLSKSV